MRALILTAVLAAPVQAHRLTETVGVRIRVRKPAVGAQVTHGVVSGGGGRGIQWVGSSGVVL